ncbi:hypothetical protein GLOIN_2v1789979 [Rhizophagus clarus]|uniref:Uncharacterized protein n=1 Tax=Rhizophagus clarus TaxID=94130 RepID=A0A8H3QPA6_9GLOM|nr:hypothetical protein GLOIN_2v1789979 [Rhizophagus clarus]
MSRQEQNWATTKDDSIIANTLFENIVLFFMTVFVLLCGSSNNNNTSSTSHEIQIHHFFLPQQHKALINILKNYSSKDSRQPLGIMNHDHHGRKNPSIRC